MDCPVCGLPATVEIKTHINKGGGEMFNYYRYFRHSSKIRHYGGKVSNLEIWGFG